jgi:hypothetical protein
LKLSCCFFPPPEPELSDQNRDERLQIMLTEEELKALDDWRFTRRMPSRAAAVRELLRRGLTAEGFDVREPRRRSKDFGVTDGRSDGADGSGADGAA